MKTFGAENFVNALVYALVAMTECGFTIINASGEGGKKKE